MEREREREKKEREEERGRIEYWRMDIYGALPNFKRLVHIVSRAKEKNVQK